MATLKLNNTTVFTETNGVASIPSGVTIGNGVKFPAGHVINFYSNRHGTEIENTTENWTNMQVGITLTPKSSSSKFLLLCYAHFCNTTSGAHGFGFLFKRDNTFLNTSPHDGSGPSATPVDGSTYRPYDFYKDESRFFIPVMRTFIDSPNTSSQITYSSWAKGYNSPTQGSLRINYAGTHTEFIIMEFAQ